MTILRSTVKPGTETRVIPVFGDMILLTLCIGVFFGILLGSRPLSVPDEGRYVEIPREMVATGNYLTPRLNGVKYFEKPPLFYWMEAGFIRVFGLDEWSVRLGPALFALLGCIAVYYAGARLFGRAAGIAAAVVLATSALYYALGRLITLDMPVTALLTASLLSFLLGTKEAVGPARRNFFWSFYIFAALATMTKGIIGILIPGMIIFWWLLLAKEWRTLRTMYLGSGLLLFLLIAAPWHIIVQWVNPEFFDFYFIHEHFQRYLTKVHGRYKPAWFFLPILLVGLFPWTAFLIQAVRRSLPPSWSQRCEQKETIFLLLWAGLVFLFFSASDSKLIPYILPALPPLAILIGRYVGETWRTGAATAPRGISRGLRLLLVLSALLIVGVSVLPRYRPELDRALLRPHLYLIIAVLVTGTAATWRALRRWGVRGGLAGLTATTALFCIACSSAMPYLDTRSVKDLALELKAHLNPGDEVATYLTYYQDLPVYLERRITVVEWTGELDFGSRTEDTSAWMMNGPAFWKQWAGSRRIYLVTTDQVYDWLRQKPGRSYFLIARRKNNVILSNIEDRPWPIFP
jgi:4-amino-4-deoxy-L-arabinose transferase-like glycosyltransferase